MRFFRSDDHLGHLRIPELAHRPFAATAEGVTAMNEELIRRHNSKVHAEDTVFNLGDFAMGKIADSLPLAAQYHGTHILLCGNHDRPSPMYGGSEEKRAGWAKKYREAGFYAVFGGNGSEAAALHAISVSSTPVMMCHLPYQDGGDSWTDPHAERFRSFRPVDQGQWLLCGHVHNAWRQHGKMINVGVDAWGGYPVSEDDLAALIKAGPRELGVLPWS